MEEFSFYALVVDDDLDTRQLLIRALTAAGCRCDSAGDGQIALQLINQHEYDLVITDLLMPHLNGHSLCMKLLQRPAPRPLPVVLTGIVEPRIKMDLARRGINHVFHKPIDFSEFSKTVLEILETRLEESCRDTVLFDDDFVVKIPAKTQQAKHTVLVLSPDSSYCQQMPLSLAGLPLDVLVAVSTDHLLEIANSRRIDLLVIDQELSGFLRGSEIVSRLHAELISLPAFLRVPRADLNKLKAENFEGVERFVADDQCPEKILELAYNYLSRLSYKRLVIEPAARQLVSQSTQVPPIPNVLTRLAHQLANPAEQISISLLASDIEKDSRLTSELIRIANSSHVSSTHKQNDLKNVIALLGPRQSISISLSLGLRTIRSELMKPWANDIRDWYLKRTSLLAATAQACARHLENVPTETAFLLGMLQEIGILVLAQHYGQPYFERVIQRVRTIPTLVLVHSERMVTNTHHGMVSAAVLQSWGFPYSMVHPVFSHHQEEDDTSLSKMGQGLVRCMRIGEAFADMCDQPCPQRIMKLNELLSKYYQKGRHETRHIFLEAIEKSNQASELLHTPPLEMAQLVAIVTRLHDSELNLVT